ncbi:MAG: sensor histidine kinase, partial [Corynebacterium sp.]|nr:sensor histidine kinase [Corynebacterium sp.]
GRLEATGELGVGACFRLTLPRRPGQEVRTSPLPLEVTEMVVTDVAVEAGEAGIVDVASDAAPGAAPEVEQEEPAPADRFDSVDVTAGSVGSSDVDLSAFEGLTEEELRTALQEAEDMDSAFGPDGEESGDDGEDDAKN